MRAIKLILFDFDGTISDSHEAAFQVYNSLSEKFGYRRVETEDLPSLRSKASVEILKHLGISLVKLPFVVREARVRFQERIHALKPFDGIRESLVELKGHGYQLGILTSNSKKNVDSFLTKNKIDVFNFVYSGASIFGKAKMIKSLLKKRSLSVQEAVYVGDETRDIEAAKMAGIQVIAVSWGFNTREILANQSPDYLIDKPDDLPPLLLQA